MQQFDDIFLLMRYFSFVRYLSLGVTLLALVYLRFKDPVRFRPIRMPIGKHRLDELGLRPLICNDHSLMHVFSTQCCQFWWRHTACWSWASFFTTTSMPSSFYYAASPPAPPSTSSWPTWKRSPNTAFSRRSSSWRSGCRNCWWWSPLTTIRIGENPNRKAVQLLDV